MSSKHISSWKRWIEWRNGFLVAALICFGVAALFIGLMIAVNTGTAGAQSPSTLPQIVRVCTGAECVPGQVYDYVKERNQLTPGGTIPTDAQTQGGWSCSANCDKAIPRITGVDRGRHVIGSAAHGAIISGLIADNDHVERTLMLTRCDGVALINFKSGAWGDTFYFQYIVVGDGTFCAEGDESAYGEFETMPPAEATATPTNTPSSTPTPADTATPVASHTPTHTPSLTATPTHTATPTATATPEGTMPPLPPIATSTPTGSSVGTPPATVTPTVTPTSTPRGPAGICEFVNIGAGTNGSGTLIVSPLRARPGQQVTASYAPAEGEKFLFWEVTKGDLVEKITDEKLIVTVPDLAGCSMSVRAVAGIPTGIDSGYEPILERVWLPVVVR